MWLISNFCYFDPDRKLPDDGVHRILEVFSERDDVGAILHGNAEAKRWLSVLAHDEAGRGLVAALYSCDVAAPGALAVSLHRHRRDRRDSGQAAVDPPIEAGGHV